jgi:hypothetical protein
MWGEIHRYELSAFGSRPSPSAGFRGESGQMSKTPRLGFERLCLIEAHFAASFGETRLRGQMSKTPPYYFWPSDPIRVCAISPVRRGDRCAKFSGVGIAQL